MKWSINVSGSQSIQDQLVSNVLVEIESGTLHAGERLAPAAELGEVLGINVNTVLAAYRRLRDLGVLEFRRGRSVRVTERCDDLARIADAVKSLVVLATDLGYDPDVLIALIQEVSP